LDRRQKVAHGDWQTPRPLADRVVRALASRLPRPATIVEPTCGTGTFLAAAAAVHPRAALRGHDLNPAHLIIAAAQLPRASLHATDFFTTDWAAILRAAEPPLLVLGNLPWVTSAGLGKLDSANHPRKVNAAGLRGLDARTGRSNFDISEWMLQRLLTSLGDTPATLAFLCKTSVAHKLLLHIHRHDLPVAPLGLWHIDAAAHFGASVDAALFACEISAPTNLCPVYSDLAAATPATHLAVVDGHLVHDLATYQRTRFLAGTCAPAWRSGVKHDCAEIFELPNDPPLEPTCLYPLLKSSDLANLRPPRRCMLVPQRRLGEDTSLLKTSAPKTHQYLERHADRLAARKSSIYRNQPPFAVFGVGDYTFAPYKVAISGLYKRLEFALIKPVEGRPVVFDDTCYFLPFTDEAAAREAHAALRSPLARAFFESRIFWAAKRPISATLLNSLDLGALQRALAGQLDPGRSPLQ
jgi:methylase of polypeptide subunit release factors